MARSPKSPSTPPTPPALRVSRSEATRRIQAQIDEGEQLLAAEPRSEEELNAEEEKKRIWSDYNGELLRQLFTTEAVAEEYEAFVGGAFSMQPSFATLVRYHRESIQSSLTRLRSIFRRLELFPTAGVSADTVGVPKRASGSSIFLVHGHNNEAKETVARFLERLSLEAVILHEQPDRGRTIIEKFEAHAEVGYAVVLLTSDDVGGSRADSTSLAPRARQNVILELGYFLGALGRTRVCALKEEGVEVPSDLSGVLYVPLDAGGAWKLRLASEIKSAGIDVDLNRAM